ncbi:MULTISPECIES: hypothetical protein [unclassified Methanosarcina]|uniref:hypothetical protein n=1 Tax=unclassified Methanosarcina TaxID=2644672 RepID=UPI0012E03AF2|nr:MULTISPECIES: hypothetical protein [unclassified Methanosarcina]
MDFDKFESLLEDQAIYFLNFKRFEDHFEGLYPFSNWKHFHDVIMQQKWYDLENPDNPVLTLELVKRIGRHFKENFDKPYPFEEWKLIYESDNWGRNTDIRVLFELVELMEAHISWQYLKGGNFINCWSGGERESSKMWKNFTTEGKGVCIKSSVKRLKECFAEDGEYGVRIGTVIYIDYLTDYLPPDKNAYYIFTHKDREHDYEKEVRVYVLEEGRECRNKKNIYVPVSLGTLIEKIYISPTADEHLLNDVKAITEKHNLKKEVLLSDLRN